MNETINNRRLKYTPRESDFETIIFNAGLEEFELTFRQPSIGQIRRLAKYASSIDAANLKAEEFPPEAIDEFISLYVDLFQPTDQYPRKDFRLFLEELPLDKFEELSNLVNENVFEKHQKKLPPISEKSSIPLKESK